MKITRRGPFGLGLLAFILTFYFSWFQNTWPTTVFRSSIGFILFFLFGYLLCYFLNSAIFARVEPGHSTSVDETDSSPEKAEEIEDGGFEALSLDALHVNPDLERITNAVRSWTNEDREG